MLPELPTGSVLYRLIALALAAFIALACAPMRQTYQPLPPSVVTLERGHSVESKPQCDSRYSVEDVKRYLHRARLALWLPSTRAVALDPERRCLVVTVESVGTARLAELLLRAAAVPRSVFLLQIG